MIIQSKTYKNGTYDEHEVQIKVQSKILTHSKRILSKYLAYYYFLSSLLERFLGKHRIRMKKDPRRSRLADQPKSSRFDHYSESPRFKYILKTNFKNRGMISMLFPNHRSR